jgi:miniconductance mechanosensitive channel
MFESIQDILVGWGMTGQPVVTLSWVILGACVIVLSVLVNFIAKKIILGGISRFIRKTKIRWDDYLLKHNVFTRLSHIAPALVIYFSATSFPGETAVYIQRFSTVYMILAGLFAFSAFMNAVVDLYRQFDGFRQRPIKGYVQIAKIIVYVFLGIYVVGIIIDRSVLPILGGLGAMTAVIMLVFKDSILGLVASIQLSGNDMVRIGDWIEMPKYNADGDVIDVTLNTVKVQNWDKTISYIPAYALVSDSYRNWRGMSESGGRRIKRSIHIDMNSIKFATEEMLKKWERFGLLTDYLKGKTTEIDLYNKELNIDTGELINGRKLTNIGTFRAYIAAYLKNNPKIHKDMTFLIRHLQPTEKGLPIEIYVFSNDQNWINYEGIQADIFDHLLAALPEFSLRVFQNPTGADFQQMAVSNK